MNKILIFPVSVMIYLLIAIPISQATTINIIYGGFSKSVKLPELVDIQVSRNAGLFGEYDIVLEISNGTQQQLQTLYIFKCGGLDPKSCMNDPGISPDSYIFENNLLEVSIPWSSLAEPGWPKSANLLIAVKTINLYGESWVASWHRIVRSDQNFNPPYHYTYDISSLNVKVPTIESIQNVETFVKKYSMIPALSIEEVTFTGAGKLYGLYSNSPPSFSGELISGSKISTISGLFEIMLSSNGNIMNGITITQNPSNFLCGGDFDLNGDPCDSGENSANCCYDCGCPSVQYCDAELGCKPKSGIALEVIPPTNTQVQNCYQQNTIIVTLRLNNPPTDLSVGSQSYILNGGQKNSISCPASGSIYTCTISVPPDPGCDAGTFIYSDNSISFDVSYSDGPETHSQTLTISLDDITVGSWACGDSVCNNGIGGPDLGENSVKCCYDCGCSSGQHCDILSGAEADTGNCRQKVSKSDFSISGTSPSNFLGHGPSGSTFTFDYQLNSPPKSLSLGEESCSATCTSGYETCLSSCSISCTQAGSTGSCSFTFTISGYDSLENYLLKPFMLVPVSYNDGPDKETDSVQVSLPTFSFGSYFCGDNVCNSPAETTENCCFDCGCAPGEFCSTINTNKASPQDMCILDDLELVADSITNTSFTDHSLVHKTNITMHVTQTPAGFQIFEKSCALGGGQIPCTINCKSEAQGNYLCEAAIPSITYYLSSFFDDSTKKIVLPENFIDFKVGYNNGSTVTTRVLSAGLPDITITPVSHCGDDGCEVILGEDADNCCIDCPCSDVYGPGSICIPGGNNPDSACMENSSIMLIFSHIDPTPVKCEIMPKSHGGGCTFQGTPAFNFYFNVTNYPSDLNLIDSTYFYDDEETDAACYSIENGDFKCPIIPKDIPEPEGQGGFTGLVPGKEDRSFAFKFETSYTDNNILILQNLTETVDFELSRVKSDVLKSCEEQKEHIQGGIEKYEKTQSIILGVAYGLVGIVAAACAAWAVCEPCKYVCVVGGTMVLPCAFTILLPLLGSTKAKLNELEQKEAAVCPAKNTGELADAMGDFDSLIYTLGGTVAGMVCMFSVATGGFGSYNAAFGGAAGGPGAGAGIAGQPGIGVAGEGAGIGGGAGAGGGIGGGAGAGGEPHLPPM